ncbi:MAG: type II methionyl aminopeptidase [Thermoplasmata archaeon]
MDEEALGKIRRAGRIGRRALESGLGLIREGASLLEVAEKTEGSILDAGALPGFPVNISRNEQAAHFTPRHNDGDLTFARGDLVKLDVGVHVDGYLADNARTKEVGTRNWTELIRAVDEAVAAAAEVLRPGTPMRLVGATIERTIQARGFRPVENLSGHKVEPYLLHGPKSVPNVEISRGQRAQQKAEAGEAYAIEPFATTGAGRVTGGKNSNIYRIARKNRSGVPEADALLHKIYADFRTLPFSERWAHHIDPKAPIQLRRLLRKGLISGYPILVEAGKGMVSQSENTVVVSEAGTEVTTVL